MSHARPVELLERLRETVVGQDEALESLILGLMARGHVLLEGASGIGKTLACRALAAAVQASFRRIAFTPDLQPSDIAGTRIFDPRNMTFATVRGPIFANIVLADEINRAPPKLQSALLEAMQEHQVTIVPETHPLPAPFLVLATMNSRDDEGTYALPGAQLDRFLFSVMLEFPGRRHERTIVERYGRADPARPEAANIDDVLRWQACTQEVFVHDAVLDYMVDIVMATRSAQNDPAAGIAGGAGPRATLALAAASRARAFLHGREYVLPDDVRAVALRVLRHRIAVTPSYAPSVPNATASAARIVASVPAP